MSDSFVVTEITEVYTVPIETGVERKIPYRSVYGLSFCENEGGEIKYVYDGKEYIQDYAHAILLPQDHTYMLYGLGSGQFPLINFATEGIFGGGEFLTFEIHNMNSYLNRCRKLREYHQFKSPYYVSKSMSLFYEMLSDLLVNEENQGRAAILSPAIKYMESHLFDPDLSVEQLAEISHISPCYFRRLFKTQYALTPKEYMLNQKINRAKELLRGSYFSVTAICAECGFSSIYHFCRTFKQTTGYTPTEYQNRYSKML